MSRKLHLRAAACLAGALVAGVAVSPSLSAAPRAAASGTVTDITNPDGYICHEPGFVGFENFAAGTTLVHGSVPAVDFTSTTGTFTWTVGDFAAGPANGQKYPAGPLTSEQTNWAAARTSTGNTSGRINLLNGAASTFSVLVKDASTFTLSAFAANHSLIVKTPPMRTPDGRHMSLVTVTSPTANISYLQLDVTGTNSYVLDSICTDAPGVPTGQLVLSSADGAPSSPIVVGGLHFGANEIVDISINGCFNGPAKTNAVGTFLAPLTICSTLQSGPAKIVATGETSHIVGTANYLVHTDWPQLALNVKRTAFNKLENTLGTGTVGGLHQLWTAQTGGRATAPDVVNGLVYTDSANNDVYAFNEQKGNMVWFFATTGTVRAAPAVDGGDVFAGSGDGKVYALNAETGAQVWTYSAGTPLNRSPLVSKGVVYVGADNGSVFAINEVTGKQVWKVSVGSAAHSTLATDGTLIFVGTDSGTLYALDAKTGGTVWTGTTTGRIRSSPVVDGGKVFVGSDDGSVYAWNASTGAFGWSYDTFFPVGAPPAAAQGLVFVGTGKGDLVALSESSGKLAWTFPTGQSITSRAAVANGVVYVASASQNLYAVTEAGGTSLLTPIHVGVFPTDITVTNGAVYVGSEDHVLYKFGL